MAEDITQILKTVARDPSGAERLMGLVYNDLRDLASKFLSRETAGHTLQATDLVSEAFLKLVNQTQVDWQGKTHFFAVGAQAMRRILVDHARTKHRQKRGGHRRKLELQDDFVASADDPELVLVIDQAITKLSALNRDHARMVECRFFAGWGTPRSPRCWA
jgi:RNA polymerase sigma factor (TIGR02999 family)